MVSTKTTRDGSFFHKQLEQNGYVADIIGDLRTRPHVYHYLVTKKGSCEILTWIQETSRERALDGAATALDSFARLRSAASL